MRQLEAALTIEDLRPIAKPRTPRAAFDYTDGGTNYAISIRQARQAFRDVEFHPGILRLAVDVDTSCTIFGRRSALPFGIAPTGVTRPTRKWWCAVGWRGLGWGVFLTAGFASGRLALGFNTVELAVLDRDADAGSWLRPCGVRGAFDVPLGVLPFHDARR